MGFRALGVASVTVLIAIATATGAEAAPILSCPGSVPGRGFTVSITLGGGSASCLASDAANINGDNTTLLNYTFIDKVPDLGGDSLLPGAGWLTAGEFGAPIGTFRISSAAWLAYSSMILVFKSADGLGTPDSAAFLLTPEVLAGGWAIIPPDGSHLLTQVNLYGSNTALVAIPEPTALVLLAIGLAAAASATRRFSRPRAGK